MSDFGHFIITKSGIDDFGNDVFEKINVFFKTQMRVELVNSKSIAKYRTIDILSADANYMDWRKLLVLIYKNKNLFQHPEDVVIILKINEESDMMIFRLDELLSYIENDYLEDKTQRMWDDDLKKEWETIKNG